MHLVGAELWSPEGVRLRIADRQYERPYGRVWWSLCKRFFLAMTSILSMHGRFLLGRSVLDGAMVGGVARVVHRCPLAPAMTAAMTETGGLYM